MYIGGCICVTKVCSMEDRTLHASMTSGIAVWLATRQSINYNAHAGIASVSLERMGIHHPLSLTSRLKIRHQHRYQTQDVTPELRSLCSQRASRGSCLLSLGGVSSRWRTEELYVANHISTEMSTSVMVWVSKIIFICCTTSSCSLPSRI